MEKRVFVAREQELAQLDNYLEQALAARGLVCFVTGQAGSGKTALVTEFARRAQERCADLAVAVGQSDAQTGAGDPHLPFREVLAQLTGDVETRLAQGAITEENAGRLRRLLVLSGQALVEVGPDLIGVFVPGAGLAARVGAFAADKVGWLDKLERLIGKRREGAGPADAGIEQSHIFEQYANVLCRLADKQPLLLVLDDLQWADAASIGLLFRLARCIGGHRILLVGTYRPEEVAIGRAGERHPLEKVLAELKRYHGDISVDLDRAEEVEGQGFVNAFLDTEPNQLGPGFRQKLFQHTGGHPLFTIELLRNMQERGDLVQDRQGRWIETSELDWESLPERVEGVIEERIGRLEQELRQMLTVGSVEGEDFTAEVVARVQAADTRGLVQRLSGELERRHRLVSAQGVRRLDPAGQRLSLYRFQHNLFQKYLYNELDEAERTYLHEDVGNALEALYGDQVDEIVVQLARHFEVAGVAEKAGRYLYRAGEQAAARFANDEAVATLSRALELIPENDHARRYAVLLARERIYDVQAERGCQAQDLAALQEMTQILGDDRKRAELALRQAAYASAISDYPAAVAAAREAIRLAETVQDAASQAVGHFQWGSAALYQGDFDTAGSQLEKALALSRAAGLRPVQANSLRVLGVNAGSQGDLDKAKTYSNESLRISREDGDRRGEGKTLNNLGIIAAVQGDTASARGYHEQALAVLRAIGDRRSEGVLLGNLGLDAGRQGDLQAARSYYEQSRLASHEIGDRENESRMLGNLGVVSDALGDLDTARSWLDQALSIAREIGCQPEEAEALANLGLLCHHRGDDQAAQAHCQRALEIAEELGARETEAKALTHLGHALVGLGHLAEAADAYRRGLALRRELGQPHMATEPLAGLARVALIQENADQAQALADEILDHLERHALEGTEEPLRIYLTCYRVLTTNQDPRAQELLGTAHRLLLERAARIGDRALRRSYLENVSAHREIVEAFAGAG